MSKIEKEIRRKIRTLLEQEDATRLKREIVNSSLSITMDHDAHVPDTLTKIRALPGVTVVGQTDPVRRASGPGGVTILNCYVKFLPNTSQMVDAITSMGKSVKGLAGVKSIKVVSVGGREVVYKGKPIII